MGYEGMADPTVYEMATWRMYNRIINHRMSSQTSEGSTSSDEESALPVSEYQQSFSSEQSNESEREATEMQKWTSQHYDEEIFQIDL